MDPPPLLVRGFQLALLVALALCWCAVVVRPRKPGLGRFLLSLPAFVVFGLSPMFVKESMVLSGCLGLVLMWVASFKLLAYSGDRGALAHPAMRGSSGLQWAALLVLPFFPAKSGRRPAQSSFGVALLGVLLKLGVWLGLNVVLLAPDGVPPTVRHVCYAVYMWMFVSLCLDAAMPLSGHALAGAGLELQPAMDAPYAATSVKEFWGHRYNQIVSATLLETVYKPIVQRRWVVAAAAPAAAAPAAGAGGSAAASVRPGERSGDGGGVAVRAGPMALAAAAAVPAAAGGGGKQQRGGPWLTLAALVASFAVSGIMHEICIAFMCGGRLEGSFYMLGFFLLQPPLILAQEAAHAALLPARRRGGAGGGAAGAAVRLVQRLVTLGLVLASAELFWASLESCRIDQRGLEEVVGALHGLVEGARRWGLLGLA